jgi:S-adenosylmethionine synthetase
MTRKQERTAEHVSGGHPDKFCDQVADRILDEVLTLAGELDEHLDPDGRFERHFELGNNNRTASRTAIECLAKDNVLIVSGEAKLSHELRGRLDVVKLAREVWKYIGYGSNDQELTVIDHIRSQSPDISQGVDIGGAGDQGIMVGYATNETPEMMPREWVLARDICQHLRDLRVDRKLPWLKSDCKSQVTINEEGAVTSIIVAAQHDEVTGPTEAVQERLEEMERNIISHAIQPVIFPNIDANLLAPETVKQKIGDEVRRQYIIKGQSPADIRVVINGTGAFAIGGPTGDAGVVGRKIVVDAYGPRVPVGGGAYSGKDPTKVDRSAAYMARHIAKNIVHSEGVKECTVTLAYAIGQVQPEMITAVTDTGDNLTSWVHEHFSDLSPGYIIEYLKLREPKGWSYLETAAYGHYGRDKFPWERIQ